MRKAILLTAAAAFLAVPAVVEAQTEIGAFAEIQNTFTITDDEETKRDVQFGEIDLTDAAHGATETGRFEIIHNEEASVTFTEVKPLTYENGTETIDVDWTCNVNRNFEDAGALQACDSDSDHTVAHNDGDGRTESYFHVGGTIDGTALTTQPIGTYEGTLRLTVATTGN